MYKLFKKAASNIVAVKHSIADGVGKYWWGLAKERLFSLRISSEHCARLLFLLHGSNLLASVCGQGHEDRQKASLYARTTLFRLCSGSSGISVGACRLLLSLECSSLRKFFLS